MHRRHQNNSAHLLAGIVALIVIGWLITEISGQIFFWIFLAAAIWALCQAAKFIGRGPNRK